MKDLDWDSYCKKRDGQIEVKKEKTTMEKRNTEEAKKTACAKHSPPVK